MKKISICIPVLNEEENIINTYNKISEVFNNSLNSYEFELIFTDNHSSDKTENILTDLCNQDRKVKYGYLESAPEYTLIPLRSVRLSALFIGA